MMEGFGSYWLYINEFVFVNQLYFNLFYGNGGCDQFFFNFKDFYVNLWEDGYCVFFNFCDDSVFIEGYMVGMMFILQWSNVCWNLFIWVQVVSFDDNGWYKGLNVDVLELGMEDMELFDGFFFLVGVFYEGD